MRPIAAISQQIWDMKYRFKTPDGAPIDKSIEDTWMRVATSLAACEADPAAWTARFYEALDGFKFIPAGRIVAGAGTARSVTLFNCFVMGTVPITKQLNKVTLRAVPAPATMRPAGMNLKPSSAS